MHYCTLVSHFPLVGFISNLLYHKTKDLNPILTITLHTGIFLAQTCAETSTVISCCRLPLFRKKMTRPLAPAMICRLPKLHISSHFWVACCSKTVSTSQQILLQRKILIRQSLSVLEAAPFPPMNKTAQCSQPAIQLNR